jgi:hypothetical protein
MASRVSASWRTNGYDVIDPYTTIAWAVGYVFEGFFFTASDMRKTLGKHLQALQKS